MLLYEIYVASLSPAYESDADLNPDVDTGDDFETSDEESEEGADEDDDLTSSVRFLSIGDGLPSFGVILAAAHFNGTLVITSFRFIARNFVKQ